MKKPEIIIFKPEFEKELLRLGVKTRFLKNRIEYCNKENEDIYEINEQFYFWSFITSAFLWDGTPEGVCFWGDVSIGIKPD